MYQISTSNGVIGYAEAIDYCCALPISGAPQVIGKYEREAGMTPTGIVFQGTVYNLPDHDDFKDADTAYIIEVNAANVLNEQQRKLAEQAEAEAANSAAIDDIIISMLEG